MFEISNRQHDLLFTIHGVETVEEAAQRTAKRLYGANAIAWRTTGTKQLSGFFQAYEPFRLGGLTSVGEPFHVR